MLAKQKCVLPEQGVFQNLRGSAGPSGPIFKEMRDLLQMQLQQGLRREDLLRENNARLGDLTRAVEEASTSVARMHLAVDKRLGNILTGVANVQNGLIRLGEEMSTGAMEFTESSPIEKLELLTLRKKEKKRAPAVPEEDTVMEEWNVEEVVVEDRDSDVEEIKEKVADMEVEEVEEVEEVQEIAGPAAEGSQTQKE